MSAGPTWYSWFTFPLFAPLSGAVNQDISAATYQGIPEIEIAIIKEVGSFGQQLGIISEAVKELAEKVGAMPVASQSHDLATTAGAATDMMPLQRLADLIERVDKVKKAYAAAVERDAERALARVKRIDPEAPDRLAARLR